MFSNQLFASCLPLCQNVPVCALSYVSDSDNSVVAKTCTQYTPIINECPFVKTNLKYSFLLYYYKNGKFLLVVKFVCDKINYFPFLSMLSH